MHRCAGDLPAVFARPEPELRRHFPTPAKVRLCSHDAGTGRKRHEKVTFSLSVHTMPVRNCTIPSFLPSQNNAGFQTA